MTKAIPPLQGNDARREMVAFTVSRIDGEHLADFLGRRIESTLFDEPRRIGKLGIELALAFRYRPFGALDGSLRTGVAPLEKENPCPDVDGALVGALLEEGLSLAIEFFGSRRDLRQSLARRSAAGGVFGDGCGGAFTVGELLFFLVQTLPLSVLGRLLERLEKYTAKCH